MAFLRLLFYSGLIFGTIITFSINENTGNSSIEFTYYFDDITPVHYDVKLIPYFKEDKGHEIYKYKIYKTHIEKYQTRGNFVLYGELNAIIDISRLFTKIGLNSPTLIRFLSGKIKKITTEGYSILHYPVLAITPYAKHIWFFHFPLPLPSGRYRLNTEFLTAIDNLENIITSLKTIVYREELLEMLDVIHLQATGARRLFPCWDKPTIKATFNISIKHHRKYQVFSNMPVQEKETCKHEMHENETYMKWTCFNTTPPMSTYIVTVVISPADFLKFEAEESRIIIWRRPDLNHMEFAEMIATRAMMIFEYKWTELKIPKVQFVAIHSLRCDNENWGLLLNSETDIIYDKNLDSVAHKIKVAWLIGRKMAYQWFADKPIINPFWLGTFWGSSGLWLIDGLTTLSGLYAIDSIKGYGNFEMVNLFIVQVYYESLRLETHNQFLIKEANLSENNAFSSFYRYIKGYYRVNYDPENWQKIAKYLNSIEYTKIHVLNRAKIIDDAFYFMINGQLNSSLFWNLTSYLGQETNYIAWYPMIKAFEHMSSIFPFPDKEVQNIKEKIKNILANLLEKIKYVEDPKESDLTKCLRQEAIKWLCILDDKKCLKKAYDKLKLHNGMSDTNKLLPGWKEWLYCKGLMSAERHIWRMVKDNSAGKYNNDRFLEFLACASNKIMDEYLESIMFKHNKTYNETQIKRNMISFLFIIAKHAKHDNVFLNILENFDKLKPRCVNGVAISIGIINHVYSEKQLKEVKNIMRSIIKPEAYKNSIKHIWEKKIILSDKNYYLVDKETIETNFYKYKNLVEEWV
ncbi:aminopeptidase N-like [Anoplolepis gracilipes]|uniref:aminopeptidase N-like n=1 Tax=Anoplolepis gracilipes TaxID=354296 RepID=UPI003B9F80AA